MGQRQRNKHEEAIDYILAMLGQLRAMAKAEQCDMLAYFIELACVEASDILNPDHRADLIELACQKRNRAT
ncbi:hypothetical protein [Chelativorans sp. Marseille-P2723]|uniref:hypothetical protein n=1 Tax=Chelativorans sp. Marseille-P2723 TaxID=2709133 RepID=UPI00156D74C9|nr:hypothetical protein [Chelativorans sp. Marseille-P2723]